MKTWQFYLVLEETELSDRDCDALHEAGCDDGTVVTRNGVTYIAFDREAESLGVAIRSAVRDVRKAGFAVVRAELDDAADPDSPHRVVWTPEDLVQDDLRDYFRHFVALSGCYHHIDSSRRPTGHAGQFHFSGFILEVMDQWYWVTAGHVFDRDEGKRKGIETVRRQGKIEIDKCVLNDSFTGNPGGPELIPFRYWEYDRVSCYDKALGLDFSAVKLISHYRQLLEANGVVALSERHWRPVELSHFDGFFMIGLPKERENGSVDIEAGGYRARANPTPVAVFISAVDDVPPEHVKPFPRFVGKVKPTAGDIEGISGGPIFGVCENDETHYLIAIQSSWYERELIFGCPIETLIERLLTDGACKNNTESQPCPPPTPHAR